MADLVPLNPRERTIYDALVRAAVAKQPCPTNGDICDMLDINSVGAASDLISRISAKGWITVTRYQSSRIVEIVETGARTKGEPGTAHWRERPGRRTQPPPAITKMDRRRQIAALTVGDVAAVRTAAEVAEPERVDREPCFMCGVRGDIGCRHRRAAA